MSMPPESVHSSEANHPPILDVRSALRGGIAQLREAFVPSFTLAAELLLLHVLGRDRTWLYAHPEEPISDEDSQHFFTLIARRAAGEPTQHLTGRQEFWGLEFEVSRDVLIPRPETEHLIAVALDRITVRELHAGRTPRNDGAGLRIADIGTGSGCIAVALAKELPAATIYATDVSGPALAVAKRNSQRHGVSSRIHFAECHLLESAVTSPVVFDLIVSNPPYVGRREAETLMREVREHEPEVALFGGEEGYEFYAELIPHAAAHLQPTGILVLELGHSSLPAVQPLLEAPHWKNAAVTNDLAGISRVIAAEKL